MKRTAILPILCSFLGGCAQISDPKILEVQKEQFIDTRDGRVYRTTNIGGLVWIAENLAYMPHVSPGSEKGGIWVYGYEGTDPAEARETAEYRASGNLYDWNTALISCPQGWHVPTDEEWKLAEIALGMTPHEASGQSWRGSTQGTRMKKHGDSGFNALLAGWRSGPGKFAFRDEHANFWTATSVDHRAYERLFNIRRPTVGRDLGDKTAGFSVRCVQTK
ncbi:hypothetical protein OOZ63_27040 [Paucibacter sp. PLA-PC-4]|uniref:FISUMP domain-containing protein n=1 Tax=Paucibacter sp. PLA-PC-4 TaxID=2993655 RepID=UPI00224AE96F|nr:FISUMP domain-containing protein [Paucibacter sp. PLA-PC-4]MCX2865485.1 hypothetical protein [Paucibacter sp. PLA-PC-4]